MSNFFTIQNQPLYTIKQPSKFTRRLRNKSTYSGWRQSTPQNKEATISKLLLMPIDHDIFFPAIKSARSGNTQEIKKIVFKGKKEFVVQTQMNRLYKTIDAQQKIQKR